MIERLRIPSPAPLLGRCVLAALVSLAGCAASPNSGSADAPIRAGLAPSPLGHYLAAKHAQAERDFAAAADLIGLALAEDPQNVELIETAFVLMASQGRMEEAADFARRLEARGAGSSTSGLLLAVERAAAEDPAGARAQLDKLVRDGLYDVIAPLMRAWLAFAPAAPEAALEALAPLEHVSGVATLYHLHAGLLNEMAGRIEAADAAYGLAIEGEQLSLRIVEIVGRFYERNGREAEAKSLHDRLAAGNPASALVDPMLTAVEGGADAAPIVATPRDGMAEALFHVGTVLYQEKAPDMAVLYTRMALRLKPDYPIAELLLADIMVEQGRIEAGIELYRSVAGDAKFGWQARLSEAEGLDDLGETERAVELLRAMAAERPGRIDAPMRLGNILRSHERFAESAAAYDTAIARIEALQPQHWSVLYFRGIALERSKQWVRAEADFLKALELQPEQPYVMNYLAYSWIELGQNYDRSLEMLRRAVELRPQDGFIVDSLGWVYYRLGRYEEAVAKLEEAIELKPEDPVINDHLGDAYWKVGRRTEARFQWQRALYFEPEDDQVGLIETKIERGLSKEASGS